MFLLLSMLVLCVFLGNVCFTSIIRLAGPMLLSILMIRMLSVRLVVTQTFISVLSYFCLISFFSCIANF